MFPYSKMIALTMLNPEGLFTAVIDGERHYAQGRFFLNEVSSDSVITDFRSLDV